MSSTVLITIISLSSLGLVASVILYFVAQKFKVYEDPRIDQVEEALPAANCGGCGFAGCRNFAEALVKADTFDNLNCPVGGSETMTKVAEILGKVAPVVEPRVAVIRCYGTPENRARTTIYDGTADCTIASNLYGGETECSFGCLGLGECVESCDFDALHMDSKTGLPVVTDDKCVACGACVTACPRNIIELRKKANKDRKIFVSCVNMDKGGPARKACKVACIGCGKCEKVCKFEAITIENNLAFIDSDKCKLCRKCFGECPTGAIHELNFPPKKPKVEAEPEKAEV